MKGKATKKFRNKKSGFIKIYQTINTHNHCTPERISIFRPTHRLGRAGGWVGRHDVISIYQFCCDVKYVAKICQLFASWWMV